MFCDDSCAAFFLPIVVADMGKNYLKKIQLFLESQWEEGGGGEGVKERVGAMFKELLEVLVGSFELFPAEIKNQFEVLSEKVRFKYGLEERKKFILR